MERGLLLVACACIKALYTLLMALYTLLMALHHIYILYRDKHDTALHLTVFVSTGSVDLARLLVKHGASVNPPKEGQKDVSNSGLFS